MVLENKILLKGNLMKKFIFIYIFYLLTIPILPDNKLYRKSDICKINSDEVAILFIENIIFKKDYCYSCHSVEFPILQWRKLIKFFNKDSVFFYYAGNIKRDELKIRKLDNNFLSYFKEGHYTVICKNSRMIYLKKGELDMKEFEKIINIVNKYLLKIKSLTNGLKR
jgi:predicted AlkP superfamily phosphohydrolase/phosphomutase